MVVGRRLELFARAVMAGFGGCECDVRRLLLSKGCISGIRSSMVFENLKQDDGHLKQIDKIFGLCSADS